MNGTKSKFMENLVITPSYYERLAPYVNAPSCHVNLLKFLRYAKQYGKSWLSLHRKKLEFFQFDILNTAVLKSRKSTLDISCFLHTLLYLQECCRGYFSEKRGNSTAVIAPAIVATFISTAVVVVFCKVMSRKIVHV